MPAFAAQKSSAAFCVENVLCRRVMLVACVILAAISSALFTLLFCGIVYPAIIASAVVSLVLLGVLLTVILRTQVRHDDRRVLPEKFLLLIEKYYPRVIVSICIEKNLEIQELRAVISGIASGVFTYPSRECQRKVETFGIKRLQEGCQGKKIPDLEDLLLQNCPAYFVHKFITLGDTHIPKEKGMSPEVYWTSPLGFDEDQRSVFDVGTWLFANTASEKEYLTLFKSAQNNTWEENIETVDLLHDRMLAALALIESKHLFQTSEKVEANIRKGDWLLRLCRHKVNWKQIQLFQNVKVECPSFIEKRKLFPQKIASSYLCLSEGQRKYDPQLALMTLED